MSEYTPGPWAIDWQYQEHRPGFPACEATCGQGQTPDRVRYDSEGELHGLVDGPGCILGPEGEHVVCTGHDYDEFGSIRGEANARVIAAAPKLLETLEWIQPSFCALVCPNHQREGREGHAEECWTARETIAKARRDS